MDYLRRYPSAADALLGVEQRAGDLLLPVR
jgi:hypothetical protein